MSRVFDLKIEEPSSSKSSKTSDMKISHEFEKMFLREIEERGAGTAKEHGTKGGEENAATSEMVKEEKSLNSSYCHGISEDVSFDKASSNETKEIKNDSDKKEDEKPKKKSCHEIEKDNKFGGEAILNSLRALSDFSQSEIAKAGKQAGTIKSLGYEVAERILASADALNAKQEVWVAIKDNILKDTEVVISKNGKMLAVNFHTSANGSASWLFSNRAKLQVHLLQTLQGFNDVDVNVYQEASETNSGDSHDGRSRNKYMGDLDPDEEDENP
ncbi:MAG: type III secretion HpaP family protein [Puniceicoccales bacterium]|jgi:hypothetical protein|nr:type III secretion HpaP family protein [Puniceicoccales bacterium]